MQPIGGGLGEAQQQRAPAWRRHPLGLGFPQDFRAIRIGDDEAGLDRHQLRRRPLGNGEVEPVAASDIVAPLAVGAKVRGRGLDFHDQHLALAIDGRDVGAAPVSQLELGQA